MRSERVEFEGSQGFDLAGRLELPDGGVRAFALFAHCFTCTKDVAAATRISRALTESGVAVLRFDFTGLGESDGDFANSNFSSNVADLTHAADFLRDRYRAPAILIGHSLGGAAVLAVTSRIPEVRAVVTIGAPAGTEHILHLLAESRDTIEEDGQAEVRLADRPFTIRRQFLDDIADQPQEERIRTLGVPLLIMHAPGDHTVTIDNAQRIFVAARHPKSFISLDGADHLLTRPADARFAAAVLASWACHYVEGGPHENNGSTGGLEPVDGTVVVSENGRGPYGNDVTVRGHQLTADEPAPVGHDTGPAPYDLLLASLGACTSMTLRMYAARKQWPLEKVTVSLRHFRIHAEDCAECETQSGHLDRIDLVIGLVGDLDEEQRHRLLEIADRCPVHRTLHAEIDIRTAVAPA